MQPFRYALRMPCCDHVAFRVADLDRSIDFYTRVLPATLVSRRQHADRWRTEVATLRPDGHEDFTLVLLMPRRVRWLLKAFHRLVPRQTRSHEHVGFRCASAEELEQRLAAARAWGAPIEGPIEAPAGGPGEGGEPLTLLEVLDPDRNAVEWVVGRAHS